MQQVLDYKWVRVPICCAETTMALYQAMRATPDHLPKERPKWKDLSSVRFWKDLRYFLGVPSLKLTVRTWNLMVGRRSFPFGARPIFRCKLLVSGRVRHQIPKRSWKYLHLYIVASSRLYGWKHPSHTDINCTVCEWTCRFQCIDFQVSRMSQHGIMIMKSWVSPMRAFFFETPGWRWGANWRGGSRRDVFLQSHLRKMTWSGTCTCQMTIVWIRWQESHLLIPATWSYPTAVATSQRLEEKKRVQDILVQDLDFDIPRLDWFLGMVFEGGITCDPKMIFRPQGGLGVVDVKIGSTYEVLVFSKEFAGGVRTLIWEGLLPWFSREIMAGV